MLYSTNTHVVAKRFGIVKAVEMIVEAGFPAIDVSIMNSWEDIAFVMDDNAPALARELSDIASSHGVVFNQSHAPFFGNADRTYEGMLKQTLPKCMSFCQTLGIKNIVVHPIHPYYFGREKELFDENIAFYKSLAPIAKEYGVKVALENMWRTNSATGRVIDSLYSCPIELANAYDALDDADAFTVCLDIGHVAITGRDPVDAIRTIGHDRLGALHVHDVDYERDLHTLPGVSKLDWEKICRALGEVDYKGDFTLEAEYFLDGFEDVLIPDALKFMNAVAKRLAQRVDSYRCSK